MTQNTTLSQEQLNKILQHFEARMRNLYPEVKVKSKKYVNMQHEFVLGAVCGVDVVMNNTSSCVPPGMFVAVMRGTLLEIETSNETAQS